MPGSRAEFLCQRNMKVAAVRNNVVQPARVNKGSHSDGRDAPSSITWRSTETNWLIGITERMLLIQAGASFNGMVRLPKNRAG